MIDSEPVAMSQERTSRAGLAGSAEANAAETRRALGHFATGVTVVTSLSRTAEPVGTTASAVSSLSLDPPMLLICLARTSATLAALKQHGSFAVNVLAAAQHDLSSHFARSGTAASWKEISHQLGTLGLPLLTGALASIECTVERLVDGGDHEIVLGRVHGSEVAPSESEPLLHYRGSYAAIAR